MDSSGVEEGAGRCSRSKRGKRSGGGFDTSLVTVSILPCTAVQANPVMAGIGELQYSGCFTGEIEAASSADGKGGATGWPMEGSGA